MIFTIGTSDRSLPGFLEELQSRGIRHLVDVRSAPFSRHAHFNAPQIEVWSHRADIFYRRSGKVLGGRSLFTPADTPYLDEIEGLIEVAAREPVAIFCAEGDPRHCHRSYAIGAALLVKFGYDPINVLRDGRDETVTRTLLRTAPDLLPLPIREAALERARCHVSSQMTLPL